MEVCGPAREVKFVRQLVERFEVAECHIARLFGEGRVDDTSGTLTTPALPAGTQHEISCVRPSAKAGTITLPRVRAGHHA